jgi:hypothetical protein
VAGIWRGLLLGGVKVMYPLISSCCSGHDLPMQRGGNQFFIQYVICSAALLLTNFVQSFIFQSHPSLPQCSLCFGDEFFEYEYHESLEINSRPLQGSVLSAIFQVSTPWTIFCS